jgi:hypothetical protein
VVRRPSPAPHSSNQYAIEEREAVSMLASHDCLLFVVAFACVTAPPFTFRLNGICLIIGSHQALPLEVI